MSDLTGEPASGNDDELGAELDEVLGASSTVPPLIEPDQGWIVDDEAAMVASPAVGDDVGDLSAEESAIHAVDEDQAPGLTWDRGPGYVDEEPSEPPARFGGREPGGAETPGD